MVNTWVAWRMGQQEVGVAEVIRRRTLRRAPHTFLRSQGGTT